MNNKTRFPLILGWLLIPYGISYYFSLKGINLRILEKYTDVFKQWVLLMSLLLFLGCIWAITDKSSEKEEEQAKPLLWAGWLAGLFLILGIVLGLFVYINPHARFAGDRFLSVTPGARTIKTELYKNLDEFPNIIILGSSRAFTLSPEYLEKQIGRKAFNMSVEGARGGDYAIQLKYILAQGPPPHLLIIEFSNESLSVSNYFNPNLQPISLIPYMPFIPATLVVDDALRDAFGLQAMTDSVYLLTLPDVQNRLKTWSFEENGLGVRKPVNTKQYQELLGNGITTRIKSMQCGTLPSGISRRAFEKFLKSALENNIGVVLYESPMNGAFYDAAYKASPDGFERCRQITHGYLESLISNYPNIFFRDLSSYKQINDLHEKGFYDAIHIRPIASEMVIDALIPDIKSAMAWALER